MDTAEQTKDDVDLDSRHRMILTKQAVWDVEKHNAENDQKRADTRLTYGSCNQQMGSSNI